MIVLVLVISVIGIFGYKKRTGIKSRKKLNEAPEDTAEKAYD